MMLLQNRSQRRNQIDDENLTLRFHGLVMTLLIHASYECCWNIKHFRFILTFNLNFLAASIEVEFGSPKRKNNYHKKGE